MQRMKRTLTLTLILALLAAYPAHAEGMFIDGSTGEMTAETTLDIHVYSSFVIAVPVAVSNEFGGDVVVSSANLEPDHHVSVKISNLNNDAKIDIQGSDGTAAEAPILIDGVQIYEKNAEHIRFDGNGSHYISGGNIDGGKAGHYTGTIQYLISLAQN